MSIRLAADAATIIKTEAQCLISYFIAYILTSLMNYDIINYNISNNTPSSTTKMKIYV